jgi:hypothetical protein
VTFWLNVTTKLSSGPYTESHERRNRCRSTSPEWVAWDSLQGPAAADRLVITILLGPKPPTNAGEVTLLGRQTGGIFRRPDSENLTRTVKVPILGGAAPDTLRTVRTRVVEANTGGAADRPIELIQVDLGGGGGGVGGII